MIKKIIFTLLIGYSSLMAQLNWTPYEPALQQANKECKPIMLVVYSDTCGACKALFNEFNNNAALANSASKYITVRLTQEEALYKYQIPSSVTPTIYLIDQNREAMVRPIEGLPKRSEDFKKYLEFGIKAMQSAHKCFVE